GMLNGPAGTALGQGVWFLDSITQGGRTILMHGPGDDGADTTLDGMVVWRLVRCLEPGEVRIKVVQRVPPAEGTASDPIELDGWRRQYVDPVSGVIDAAYAAGEMTQSLCSPWQHDFRDCGCHYWASNHPDVVLGEDR